MSFLCIAGCGINHSESEHHHEHEEHEEEGSNIVHFSTEMMEKVEFRLGRAELGHMGQVIHTVGQIQPRTGAQKAIVAGTSGILSFVSPDMADGMSVRQGDALFYIESGAMADRNMEVMLAEARSSYELAQQTYSRKHLLAGDNIVSAAELQQAKSDLDQAKARFDALNGNFADGRQTVRAPMSGYVTEIAYGSGHYVEAGSILAHVAQSGELQVMAQVSPRYYGVLTQIDDIICRPVNSSETVSMREQGGRVISFGKSVSSDRPLLPVIFTIKPMRDIPSGTFIDVCIRCKGSESVITVPNGALVEEMGSYSVYVQTEPEHFEKRQVRTGTTDGRNTVIESGLEGDETIVTEGAIFVKLAAAGGRLDAHAGHVH